MNAVLTAIHTPKIDEKDKLVNIHKKVIATVWGRFTA